jgi:hypothetical protein
VSERKQKYRAGRTTIADRPLTMTLRRVDWARVAVALRIVAKQVDSKEHLRLSKAISQALNEERAADLEREGMWVDVPGHGRVRVQILEALDDEPD